MEPEEADALLEKEITKEYKKAEAAIVDELNEEGIRIVKKLDLEERVFATSKLEAFQNLKALTILSLRYLRYPSETHMCLLKRPIYFPEFLRLSS